jgi:hypothetical protein
VRLLLFALSQRQQRWRNAGQAISFECVDYIIMYQKPDFLYGDDNEDSAFVSEIERDSNICNSCYRKTREHFPTVNEIASPITEYENEVNFEYFDDFQESGRANAHKPYCKCGAVDWQDARIRPLSDEEMVDIAERLSNHLSRKEVEHSPQRLMNYVREHSRLPDYQDREELVFEEAVVYSLADIKTESADEEILKQIKQ